MQTLSAPMAQHGDTLPLMERVLDLESKLEKQQETMEKLREEATEAKLQEAVKTTEYRVREEMTPKPSPEAISEEQLVALQARLDGVHVTKLLTDEVSTEYAQTGSMLSAGTQKDGCVPGRSCSRWKTSSRTTLS